MSDKKAKPAFPGRTGMGIDPGMTKLEWMTVQLLAGALADPDTTLDFKYIKGYVQYAEEIIKQCAAADKEGQ